MADKTPAQIKAEQEAAAAEKRRQEEQRKLAEANKQPAQPPAPDRTASARSPQSTTGRGTVPGAMSTYRGADVPAGDTRGPDRGFQPDEIKGMAGDVERGEIANLELDENGTPTGNAFRGVPDAHINTAPVFKAAPATTDELVTVSGAPITKYMNPQPKLHDEGMLARNPPPAPTERDEQFKTAGGGVVNQPVQG